MPMRRRMNTVRPCAAAASSLRIDLTVHERLPACREAVGWHRNQPNNRALRRNLADECRKYLLAVTADRSGRDLQLIAPGEERGLEAPSIGGRYDDESDGGDRGKDLEPTLHVWMSTLSCSK